MSVEHFVHGQEITLQPFRGTDVSLCAEIVICHADDDLPTNTGIERVQVPMLDNGLARIKAIDAVMATGDAFEEVWHADYEDADNGNCWDQQGTVTVVLNRFRLMLGWPVNWPSLDKLIVSKSNHIQLNEFHTDHFGGDGRYNRSKGHADRTIINIGDTPRWLAFIVANNMDVAQHIGDAYEAEAYATLALSLKHPTLLLVESEAYGVNGRAHGLCFNSFLTLHSSHCIKNQAAIVLTHWRSL
ncbi:MAG: hypothetical protein O2966_02850 [Proteobacteria bacterium]|nr:hypothetical protein [Pseudomonadota bacterium]